MVKARTSTHKSKPAPNKNAGFLTPEAHLKAQEAAALVAQAKSAMTAIRYSPGDVVQDRDGRDWMVQAKRERTYLVSPVPLPEYGDLGYVFRQVTDDQIERREFGFNTGPRMFQDTDGEFRTYVTDFT